MTNVYAEVIAAEARIRPYVQETPLVYAFSLSEAAQSRVYLKLENLQTTGSFKLRGAFNKLLTLSEERRRKGIVAASTGNHGLAVAHALTTLGLHGAIYLPENTAPQKVALLKRYNVDLIFHGTDGVEAEQEARRRSEREETTYISPYNDLAVLAGQGTIAIEVMRQLHTVDTVMASVGGGGLIAGTAGYLKATQKDIDVIGCLPDHSPVMYASLQAGRIVDGPVQPTLSDGTAGGIEADAITFALCRHYVDDWMLVSEDAIRDGIRHLFDHQRLIVEGSAGVTAASFLQHRDRFAGKTVVLILCGSNIDMGIFKTLVC